MGLFGMLCAGFSFIGCIIFFKACCTTLYDEHNVNSRNNYQRQDDWRPLIVREIIVNNPNEYFNEHIVNDCNEPNEYFNECVVNERVNECNEPNEYIVYERPDKPPNYDSVMNSLPNDDVSC